MISISMRRQFSIFYVDLNFEPGSKADSKENTSTDTLLLLHGFPSCSADFQGGFLEKLPTRFNRIITFDYPGPELDALLLLISIICCLLLNITLCCPDGRADDKYCAQATVSATSPGAWSHPRTPSTPMQMWRSASFSTWGWAACMCWHMMLETLSHRNFLRGTTLGSLKPA